MADTGAAWHISWSWCISHDAQRWSLYLAASEAVKTSAFNLHFYNISAEKDCVFVREAERVSVSLFPGESLLENLNLHIHCRWHRSLYVGQAV